MKPVRIFRHEDWIHSGRLTDYLSAHDVPWELVAIDCGENIPQRVDDVSALAFLGGTMSVNDDYPWLEEMDLMRLAASHDVPMLGHLHGFAAYRQSTWRQRVADAGQGDRLVRGQEARQPRDARLVAGRARPLRNLHLASRCLHAAPGAMPLYSSAHCAEQAYVIGNAVAMVAHTEVTPTMLEDWLRIYGYDIASTSERVQSVEAIRHRMEERCAVMHRIFTDKLRCMVGADPCAKPGRR
jgi:GMP synthase-like glutamine amidotransferase